MRLPTTSCRQIEDCRGPTPQTSYDRVPDIAFHSEIGHLLIFIRSVRSRTHFTTDLTVQTFCRPPQHIRTPKTTFPLHFISLYPCSRSIIVSASVTLSLYLNPSGHRAGHRICITRSWVIGLKDFVHSVIQVYELLGMTLRSVDSDFEGVGGVNGQRRKESCAQGARYFDLVVSSILLSYRPTYPVICWPSENNYKIVILLIWPAFWVLYLFQFPSSHWACVALRS